MIEVRFRTALPEDIPDLAQLAIMAGNGILDAIYQGVVPSLSTSEIVEQRFHRIGTTKSYENCCVAVHGNRVVGCLNAYPMDDEILDPPDPLLRHDRRYLVEPAERLHAPGSFHLNTVAVLPEYRSQGIGTSLLRLARSRAQDLHLPALSLIVFEQNHRAVALYRRFGFSEVKHSKVAEHAAIQYSGNLTLMICPVQLAPTCDSAVADR